MSEDRYEITNPWAVKWHGSSLHILEKEDDPSFRVLDSEAWDVKFTVEATRKPEPIKAGQTWCSSHKNGVNKKIVRHVYFDETVGESVIVYQQPDDTWAALPERQFRFTYRKELPE